MGRKRPQDNTWPESKSIMCHVGRQAGSHLRGDGAEEFVHLFDCLFFNDPPERIQVIHTVVPTEK